MKTLALLSFLLVATSAFAGDYRDAHRLGGSTSFHHPKLTTRASVSTMVNKDEADLKAVLADAGLSNLEVPVITALRYGYQAPAVDNCNTANPVDGALVQCNFQIGGTLEWMAYRPGAAKGNKTPALMRKLRWAGKKPFRAFLFRVSDGDTTYTFVLPKDCGNLALMDVSVYKAPLPEPTPEPTPVPECNCPPPAIVVVPGETITKTVEVKVEKPRRLKLFAEGDFGKDRRVRNAESGVGTFAQCTPLLAAKLGGLYKFDSGWEVGAAVGTTYPLVDDKKKAKQEEVFADIEANRYIGRGYVGGGVSFWDITRTEATRQGSYTPAILMHFGIPVGSRVHIVGEDRVFTRQLDDISNNYQFWMGARVRF